MTSNIQKPKQYTFSKPFIVYRTESENSIIQARKISKYILSKFPIETIYIEKPDEVNIEIIYNTEEEKQLREKYKNIFKTFSPDNEDSDLCIIIGGDGTCLWANYCYRKNKNPPPLITFHLGFLGYLAIYDINNYKEVFDELEKGNFVYEKRNLISSELYKYENDQITNKKKINNYIALNEILIQRGSSSKMICLNIFMDNEPLSEVFCDGIIFASPTGSTAYSLSAGGPLLHYEVEGLVLSSICPFSLSFRPIVIPKEIVLSVKIGKSGCEPIVVNDGMIVNKLKIGELIEIRLSDGHLDFIVLNKFVPNRSVLWKEKIVQSLGWNNAFKH
jgi:NAD+ kinase